MRHLNLCIKELFESNTVKNLIVRVGNRDSVFCDIKRSSEKRTLTDTTLFDMASLSQNRSEWSIRRSFPTERLI